MHYYKRHLGDYARDTGHLTALEHGIYTLLLDWYYVNERPIPADKAVRIARGNPEETRMVLEEYFELTDEGWRHHYADREIAEYQRRSEHNREVGKLGGRPKKTQTVSEREPERNPQKTLTTNHKPLTKNQEPKEQKREQATRSPTGSRLPPDWKPSEDESSWARKERPDLDIAKQADRFRDYWIAKTGKEATKLDWTATWRNWIRNAHAEKTNGQPTPPARTRPLL